MAYFFIGLFAMSWFTGCYSHPDKVTFYSSPSRGLSYRVEEFNGHGAVSASSTALFAVYQVGNKHDERLVLSGTYLDLKDVHWVGPAEGYVCVVDGYTETYRRIVRLTAGSNTQGIYTHITDQCSQLMFRFPATIGIAVVQVC